MCTSCPPPDPALHSNQQEVLFPHTGCEKAFPSVGIKAVVLVNLSIFFSVGEQTSYSVQAVF